MAKTKNEVTVAATSGGRRITLEPLAEGKLEIDVKRVESSIPCGFRQEWISGEDKEEGLEFSLTSGAGVGSPYMVLKVNGHGEEIVDMREVLPVWIDGLLAREKEASDA